MAFNFCVDCRYHAIYLSRTRIGMIMERLNGPTLRQYVLDKTELDEGEAASIFRQVPGARRAALAPCLSSGGAALVGREHDVRSIC